jgi:phytanoyl-CoA hydroxylase
MGLEQEQVDFYAEHGYLHVPGVFSADEVDALTTDLEFVMETWASESGWTGPWREAMLGAELAERISLLALHDLQLYSAEWARAVLKPGLARIAADLLGGAAEFHHSTLHVKPPEQGQPFPMHQDHPFYRHTDDRYLDVLVHLDDTRHENGEIRFLDGSHKLGVLPHIEVTAEGEECSPHLPTDRYRLEDTVPVPARKGDIVCFNILTVHGSYLNSTSAARRLVRVGYRHPDNRQLEGQSAGRPGWMAWGQRRRTPGDEVLTGD